jgi:two-component system LytT family response regulator
MKILVIDNEPEIRNVLLQMLQQWNNDQHLIAEAEGVKSGFKKINEWQPDIVLLDVEMDDGTGFDLLQQIFQPKFQLIFTTAHNKYAVQAFKFSAIDYLLKPIDPIELQAALQKALDNISSTILQNQLQVLMQQLNNKTETDKQIVLKDIDRTYFVKIKDILFCEAEGAYTKFYLQTNEEILVSKNLRFYEELLTGFIRTHHSCLVNPAKIKMYDRKTDSGTIVLEGGRAIPVSQRKKEFVLQYLEGRGLRY